MLSGLPLINMKYDHCGLILNGNPCEAKESHVACAWAAPVPLSSLGQGSCRSRLDESICTAGPLTGSIVYYLFQM